MTVTYTPTGVLLVWGVTGYQLQVKTDLVPVPGRLVGGYPGLGQITVPYSSGIQFFRLWAQAHRPDPG